MAVLGSRKLPSQIGIEKGRESRNQQCEILSSQLDVNYLRFTGSQRKCQGNKGISQSGLLTNTLEIFGMYYFRKSLLSHSKNHLFLVIISFNFLDPIPMCVYGRGRCFLTPGTSNSGTPAGCPTFQLILTLSTQRQSQIHVNGSVQKTGEEFSPTRLPPPHPTSNASCKLGCYLYF